MDKLLKTVPQNEERCEIHKCGLRLMDILGVQTKYCPKCQDEMKLTETTPIAEDITVRISVTFMIKTDRGTYEYHAMEVNCKICPHESALDNAVGEIQDMVKEKYGVEL